MEMRNIADIVSFHPVYTEKVLDMMRNYDFDNEDIVFPVINVGGNMVLIDGHHRLVALALKKAGVDLEELTPAYLEERNLLYVDLIPAFEIKTEIVNEKVGVEYVASSQDIQDILEGNKKAELSLFFGDRGSFYPTETVDSVEGIFHLTNNSELVIQQKLAITEKLAVLKTRNKKIRELQSDADALRNAIEGGEFERVIILYWGCNYTNPDEWYEINFRNRTITKYGGWYNYSEIQYFEELSFGELEKIVDEILEINYEVKIKNRVLCISPIISLFPYL